VRRFQSSASHATTPDTWNVMMVLGRFKLAVNARTWENIARKKSNMVGLNLWKGLLLETPYFVAIQLSSKAIRTT